MVNHFDTVAHNWDKNQSYIKRTEAVAKALRNTIELNPQMTALEFGAGTGMLGIALKDYFSEITLMDSSFQMVCETVGKIAAKGIPNLYPVFFDLEKDEYTAKTFDVIFSQMTLHHIIDVNNVIVKLSNLLNPGGKIALVDLYKEDGTFHSRPFTGHNGFDTELLMDQLRINNFHNVSCKQCYVIEKQIANGTMKDFPIFLITAERY